MKRITGLAILAAFAGVLLLTAPLMAMEKANPLDGQNLQFLSKGNGNGGGGGNGGGSGGGGNGAHDGTGPKGDGPGSGECDGQDCANPDCPWKKDNS